MATNDHEIVLLRLAARLARLGGWSVEVPGGEIFWSAELFDMLGFEPAAGPPPFEVGMALYPDEYRQTMQDAVERCQTLGTPIDLESVIRDRHGRRLWVRTIGRAVRDQQGSIVRIEGAFYDISEVVGAREERIAAQEALTRTLNLIPDVICFIDREWRVMFGNDATLAVSRMTESQMAAGTIWELFPEPGSGVIGDLLRAAMDDRRSGSAREYVEQVGAWMEVTAHPIDDGIAVFARDVSMSERQRQALAEMEGEARRLASLVDASNEAMIMEDLDHVVTYWNQGAERVYGWSRDEVIGNTITDVLYDDPRAFEAAAALVRRDGVWNGELVQKTKSGATITVDCRWQGVRDDAGRVVSLFAVNSDITQRRREQELQGRAHRMESLGTLAGGIAHDLNNVLTPLMMSVQLMQKDDLDPFHRELLDGMKTGLSRGADMIRQVLAFARGVGGERAVVSVHDVVAELSSVALNTLPKSIDVVLDVPESPAILGDKTQILQVLINLVTNARDAMPDGGVLRITAARHRIDQASVTVSPLTPGEYALLSVEDSGVGMQSDVLGKIFEPFYTTKEFGSGTGLGLSSSHAIVVSHGGRLAAYSEPGKGSRFDVYLPIAEADGPAESRGFAPESVPIGSGELVLIVDDEASIRRIVSQTLQAHGYRSVEASNGREAIAVYTEHADEVRLLLTDMMMPVMDGAATAAYFAAHHPHVAIVAASGLHANGGVARASGVGVRHFVAKPFTTETLLRTIRLALTE